MSYKDRLSKVIPGGAHTYSRGDDQFPSNAPEILMKGSGAYVWGPHGDKYLDYGMGLRSVNIGYANKEVAEAVMEEILKGNNLTRASVTELIAAELMSEIIDSAEMVKFAKHGSTVTTAAIKLARAYTGRKFIAVPHEQPFFSFDDWFIGSTVLTKGTLQDTSSYTLKFHYNNLESLTTLFAQYPNQIAAVMLEPATTLKPCADFNNNCDSCTSKCKNGNHFLHEVKKIAHKNGALFVLDEMITGFRWSLHGAQQFYDITPDLSTFGKAMANGFAVAALTGRKEIMSLGSIIEEGAERVFLTSTTHGAEMSGLGAFIKTVEIMKRDNVIDHFFRYGNALKMEINGIAKDLGISDFFYVEGYGCSPNYITKDKDLSISLPFRTLFSQEMIKKGVIMPYIAISNSHKELELDFTLEAVRSALTVYKNALESGIESFLEGQSIKPVFRKYN